MMELSISLNLKLTEEETKEQELNNPNWAAIQYVNNNREKLEVQDLTYTLKNRENKLFKIIYIHDIAGNASYNVVEIKPAIIERLLKRIYNCYKSSNATKQS